MGEMLLAPHDFASAMKLKKGKRFPSGRFTPSDGDMTASLQ